MKKSKTVGLGWANRAVSGKPTLDIRKVKESRLVELADDLVAAITMADFNYCAARGRTTHMNIAIFNYLEWRKDNHVE